MTAPHAAQKGKRELTDCEGMNECECVVGSGDGLSLMN